MLKVSAVKGAAEGKRGIALVLDRDQRIQDHRPAGVEIDLVRTNPGVLPGVWVVAIDLELLYARCVCRGVPSLSEFDARFGRYLKIPRYREPLQHGDARELL